MISKLIKNGETIFLQTTTDAVLDNESVSLTNIITELREENETLKTLISELETKLTELIDNTKNELLTNINSIGDRVDVLEVNGDDWEERIKTLENKTQKLGTDGDFEKSIKAPSFYQKN